MITMSKCFLVEIDIISTEGISEVVAKLLEAEEENADERVHKERKPVAARLCTHTGW
jgi:hypothetical protein